MIEQVLNGIFAGLRVLATVAPPLVDMITGGQDVDALEARCFEQIKGARRVADDWDADLARRIREAEVE